MFLVYDYHNATSFIPSFKDKNVAELKCLSHFYFLYDIEISKLKRTNLFSNLK